MTSPDLDGLDETYAKLALRILIRPRDMEWHNDCLTMLDEGPDYARPPDGSAIDATQMAGRCLGYCCGLVEWTPDIEPNAELTNQP